MKNKKIKKNKKNDPLQCVVLMITTSGCTSESTGTLVIPTYGIYACCRANKESIIYDRNSIRTELINMVVYLPNINVNEKSSMNTTATEERNY